MQIIKYWYIGGDIHGDWRPIRNWVVNSLTTPKDESAIILLGDVGANYYGDYRDRNFKKELNKLGISIYCIRGNHEQRITDVIKFGNFTYRYDFDVKGYTYQEQGFPNIFYFNDAGGIYEIAHKQVLIIPGAYSIDKHYRLQMGWNWFSNEQLDYNEQERLKIFAHDMDFDYILAHTCPLSWEPYIQDLFMSSINQSTVDKTTEKFLDDIIDDCSYKRFYFGHFHDDRDLPLVNATMLFREIIPLGQKLNRSLQVD